MMINFSDELSYALSDCMKAEENHDMPTLCYCLGVLQGLMNAAKELDPTAYHVIELAPGYQFNIARLDQIKLLCKKPDWKKPLNDGSLLIEKNNSKITNLMALGSPERILASIVYCLIEMSKSAEIPISNVKATINELLDI